MISHISKLAVLLVLAFAPFASAQAPAYDILIRGGMIVDGTGNPAFPGDVAIKSGRIVAVGNLRNASAARVIDASNRVVAPGFIDLHTHSDIPLLADGNAQSAVRDGVTLDVIGESETVAPRDGMKQEIVDGVDINWKDFPGYFARIREKGISLNLLSFVSAHQIRGVMGYDLQRATAAQQAQMEKLMARSMEEGAWGLVTRFESGGPEFPDEIIGLAKVAASYGGRYNSHIGSEGFEQDKELAFVIRVAGEARIPAETYHLKIRGKQLWGTVGKYTKMIEDARVRGLDVTSNQYPYTAMHHQWAAFFPVWVRQGGNEKFTERLKDPALRAKLKADHDFNEWVEEHGTWEGIRLGRTYTEKYKPYEGKSVAFIAAELKSEPAETSFDIMAADGARTTGIFFNMSEDDIRTVMRKHWVAVGSDGAALNVDAPGLPHARSFGTHARILGHYVREEGVLTWEDGIRKMTSLPAQILGLSDRGQVHAGFAADMVVFDPKTVGATNSLEKPKSYSKGFDLVMVNGVAVVEKDQHTGARPGQVIYGPGFKGP